MLGLCGVSKKEGVRQFEQLYKEKIVAVNANEIANDGGILNSITWNILLI